MQNWRRIHVTLTHQEVQIFSPNFFGTLPIPIPPISLLLVIIAGSLVEVFSVRAHLHVNGMESLGPTNYAEYVPFWSKNISSTHAQIQI
jgi:hypothetical protein